MLVPTDDWNNGAWNSKLPQFRLLAEMLGLSRPSIAPGDLQDLFRRVASAKAFADNTQAFLAAANDSSESAAQRIRGIEKEPGLTEALPFMSMTGIADPRQFNGVAIWPAGTANWTKLRLEQILLAQEAGAQFRHVVCLNSSRVCGLDGERKHPLIAGIPAGEEPTERELQRKLVGSTANPSMFRFPELPRVNADGKPLSLEQQLKHLRESGQYDELIGQGTDIYVPSTPNSLYVPLHIRRILGHDDVWFSQAGAGLVNGAPKFWWPSLQDVMTLPNGIIRLWVELLEAGCINK